MAHVTSYPVIGHNGSQLVASLVASVDVEFEASLRPINRHT
jgi:hypothetical protein